MRFLRGFNRCSINELIAPYFRNIKFFANFFGKIIVDVRMTWYCCHFAIFIIDKNAVTTAFSQQSTSICV